MPMPAVMARNRFIQHSQLVKSSAKSISYFD
jgi:hypothetical protein